MNSHSDFSSFFSSVYAVFGVALQPSSEDPRFGLFHSADGEFNDGYCGHFFSVLI